MLSLPDHDAGDLTFGRPPLQSHFLLHLSDTSDHTLREKKKKKKLTATLLWPAQNRSRNRPAHPPTARCHPWREQLGHLRPAQDHQRAPDAPPDGALFCYAVRLVIDDPGRRAQYAAA